MPKDTTWSWGEWGEWLGSFFPYFSSQSNSSPNPQSPSGGKKQISQNDFDELVAKYNKLRKKLIGLRKNYQEEKQRAASQSFFGGVSTLISKLPGLNHETERYHAIDFIQSVAIALPNDIAYPNVSILLNGLEVLEGVIQFEKMNIDKTYIMSEADGSSVTIGSSLYKFLKNLSSKEGTEEVAMSLAHLKKYLSDHKENVFTYPPKLNKEQTQELLEEYISQLSPKVAHQMHTA